MVEYVQRDPKTSFWRALVRVVILSYDKVYLCFPSWDHECVFPFSMEVFPEKILKKMEPDFRFYVYMNKGVEDFRDLQFRDWHLAKASDPPGNYLINKD